MSVHRPTVVRGTSVADPPAEHASRPPLATPRLTAGGQTKSGGTPRLCRVTVSADSYETSSHTDRAGDPSQAWAELAPDYERSRSKDDSLDRLVEWPAQRDLLGDVTGRSVLDVGCGNGGKLAELVGDGAAASVGVDISANFLGAPPPGLELIRGDLSELDSLPELAGRSFDRILFLQSFGYAKGSCSHASGSARDAGR